MKYRPVLFSAPMVRAILEGRKTQTRRVVKGAALDAIKFCTGRADDKPGVTADLGVFYEHPEVEDSRGRTRRLKCPEWLFYNAEYPDEGSIPVGQGYGAVGDRLWVRETWAPCNYFGEVGQENGCLGAPLHRASWPYIDDRHDAGMIQAESIRWRPSIHMPRWASRITLEITSVRIERLQEISDADARAEGVAGCDRGKETAFECSSFVHFLELWESINGDESWAANPWVWVIEFKRIETAKFVDVSERIETPKFVDVTGSDEDAGDSPV